MTRFVTQRGRPNRSCDACGATMETGPDACLGFLPGVSHACCGHGKTEDAYVVLGGEPDQSCLDIERMLTLRGDKALQFFELVRSGAADPVYETDVRL